HFAWAGARIRSGDVFGLAPTYSAEQLQVQPWGKPQAPLGASFGYFGTQMGQFSACGGQRHEEHSLARPSKLLDQLRRLGYVAVATDHQLQPSAPSAAEVFQCCKADAAD